ncbi:MAG: carbohydrate ABC transporter permease [Bacillota bacterium]|jgi:multiple sugar transport system permease protein|nr:carbohydrate ABC transporter permease [Bacillota bacterium]HHT89368.1 carbohydrate ABC transporter permease [Bacillota bacterium]
MMLMTRNGKQNIGQMVLTLIMIAAALIMIIPLVWMISTSFKTQPEVFAYPVKWLPERPTWEAHRKVWLGALNFVKYYRNSLKIAVLGTVGAITFGSMAAYGFARVQFRGRNLLFGLYLLLMMVPPQILFVPKFIMFDWAGIYNTHWALFLPTMFTIIGVFYMRQHFLTLPKELTEAAIIDGAGHFTMFRKIFLPLAKPTIVTFAILDFTWAWNNYEDALVFLIDEDLYTVPLGLNNFLLEYSIDYPGMMAAATASIIPIVLVFLFGQRYIIEGLVSSSVKG